MQDLDRPTTSWVSNTRVDRRFFKDGYQGVAHRNLLRDGVDHSPAPEPGVELDGVTIITNATDNQMTSPSNLPPSSLKTMMIRCKGSMEGDSS